MPEEPVVTVYNRIVSLLQAQATFFSPDGSDKSLVRPRNFIVYSGNTPYPEKLTKGSADFPEADLDEGAFSDSAFTKTRTFARCAWKEEFTQIYVLTLTMQDNRLEPAAILRGAACRAMRKAHDRLGLSTIVKSWGPITSTAPDKTTSNATGGTIRRVLKIFIPVTFSFDGSDLVI